MISADPATAKPIGVTVDKGNIHIKIDADFGCPVDVVFGAYAPEIDNEDVYFLDSAYSLKARSLAAVEDAMSKGPKKNKHKNKLDNLVFFKTNVFGVHENLKATLPPGLYVLTLGVKPSGNSNEADNENENESSLRWITHFTIK